MKFRGRTTDNLTEPFETRVKYNKEVTLRKLKERAIMDENARIAEWRGFKSGGRRDLFIAYADQIGKFIDANKLKPISANQIFEPLINLKEIKAANIATISSSLIPWWYKEEEVCTSALCRRGIYTKCETMAGLFDPGRRRYEQKGGRIEERQLQRCTGPLRRDQRDQLSHLNPSVR